MKHFLYYLFVCSLLMIGGCGQQASLNMEQNEEKHGELEEFKMT